MLSASNADPLGSPLVPEGSPRLLLACEDRVLLEAMTRIVSWMRPGWAIEAATGTEAVRRMLAERAFDVLVCGVEPRAECGGEMLHHARVAHPQVLRVAYRTSDACKGPELMHAHEMVPWPADVTALIQALDRAVDRLQRRLVGETETPCAPSLQVV
jgi:DNA-binding NtrC family response regulator